MNNSELQIVNHRGIEQEVRVGRARTLPELWDIFVRLRGDIAKNTELEYRKIGKKFLGFMEGRKLDATNMVEWVLHEKDRTRYSKAGQVRINPWTINNQNVRVRAFLRWLKTINYTNLDLADAIVTLPVQPRPEPQMITEEEYQAIKRYCTGRPSCQLHLWLIILGYRTGMSLVDCCYLRWPNVILNDDGPSYIDIYRIKTKRLGMKARCFIPIIPMSDVHEWLLRLKAAGKNNYARFDGIRDFVHQDAPGHYECRFQTIGNDFKNIFMRAGLERGKTFRNLRNSFCSNLVNSDAQIALICKMTGHNSVTTLLRYLKPDKRMLQDALLKAQQFAAKQSHNLQPPTGLPA